MPKNLFLLLGGLILVTTGSADAAMGAKWQTTGSGSQTTRSANLTVNPQVTDIVASADHARPDRHASSYCPDVGRICRD